MGTITANGNFGESQEFTVNTLVIKIYYKGEMDMEKRLAEILRAGLVELLEENGKLSVYTIGELEEITGTPEEEIKAILRGNSIPASGECIQMIIALQEATEIYHDSVFEEIAELTGI